MKVTTAALLAAMLGVLSLLVHAGGAFMSLLGTGLASTPDTPVPDRATTLWGIALWGTPLAGLALLVLMIRWSKAIAIAYAMIWVVLIGCFQAGWLVNGTPPIGLMLLEGVIPVASVVFALYGVWAYHAREKLASR